jgi:hypothetical protein
MSAWNPAQVRNPCSWARTNWASLSRNRPAETPAPGLPAPGGGTDQPGAAGITVTIWHNVAFDAQGRHVAMLDGYQPGDPMVRVFAYQASPGRSAEEIADEVFDTYAGADLVHVES